MRKVFPKKIPLPDEITKDGSREVLSNDTDIAQLFNQQFVSVFNVSLPVLDVGFDFSHPSIKFSPDFSVESITMHILNLNSRSAPGYDKITPALLISLAANLAPYLSYLFEIFYANAFVHVSWKIGVVAPIYKKNGDPNNPLNYRPHSYFDYCEII